MDIKYALGIIVKGTHLTESEAEVVLNEVMEGRATAAQIGAFLTAMRLKGETVPEITGFVRAMRSKAFCINACLENLVDTCGTGGDGSNSFNISTTAAFVVAGAGVPVAKHGNRSVSSRCGSADVLEELGVEVELSPTAVEKCLNETGIAFMFAPRFHEAMKYAAGPRREIGIRTVFNILGPLTNPAGARAQVLGVYDASLTEVMAAVLQRLGSSCAYVVHGCDGLDEITITGETKVTELRNNRIRTFSIAPEQVGLQRAPLESIRGGTAKENARLTRAVLLGEKGPCRDIVLLNSAFALMAAGRVSSPREGIELSFESIDSGAAYKKLQELAEFSRSSAA